MNGLLLAPFAPLFELYLPLNFFSVFSAPIIDSFAFGAGEFYEKIL